MPTGFVDESRLGEDEAGLLVWRVVVKNLGFIPSEEPMVAHGVRHVAENLVLVNKKDTYYK